MKGEYLYNLEVEKNFLNTQNINQDFPDGAVGKNPPTSAGKKCNPLSRKIPHAVGCTRA